MSEEVTEQRVYLVPTELETRLRARRDVGGLPWLDNATAMNPDPDCLEAAEEIARLRWELDRAESENAALRDFVAGDGGMVG